MNAKTRRVVSGDEDVSRWLRLVVDFLGREEKDETELTAEMRSRKKSWRFILLRMLTADLFLCD